MSRLYPEINPGSYWICQPTLRGLAGIGPHDIFCKVLSVNEDKIHIIRKTAYGFVDMAPVTLRAEVFLEYYMRLED